MIYHLKYNLISIFVALVALTGNSQTSVITGVILNSQNEPIENVNINSNTIGTISNSNGFYIIRIPSNKNIKITFSHLSYKSVEINLNLKQGDKYIFNPVLNSEFEQIETVVIRSTKRSSLEGVTTISPKIIRTIKGAQPCK